MDGPVLILDFVESGDGIVRDDGPLDALLGDRGKSDAASTAAVTSDGQ